MKLLLHSILARVQRDNKVILHDYIFEGSHSHMICTAKDACQCQEFYGQIKKQITDSIKRLLGLKHLNIWQDRASVIEIPTLDNAIASIVYLYANPSNDDLEESIKQYPGVSSWEVHLKATKVDEAFTNEHPWIQLPMIPELSSPEISHVQDLTICENMVSAAKKKHVLKIYPYQWLKLFIKNANAQDLTTVKKRILDNLRQREKENSKRRQRNQKQVLGQARLRHQPLLSPHTPKKNNIKIIVHSMFKDIRKRIIDELKYIDDICRKTYQRWKHGDFSVIWPPGTFPPPLPPMANALSF